MAIGRSDEWHTSSARQRHLKCRLIVLECHSRNPSGPAAVMPHQEAGHMTAVEPPPNLPAVHLNPAGRPHMPRDNGGRVPLAKGRAVYRAWLAALCFSSNRPSAHWYSSLFPEGRRNTFWTGKSRSNYRPEACNYPSGSHIDLAKIIPFRCCAAWCRHRQAPLFHKRDFRCVFGGVAELPRWRRHRCGATVPGQGLIHYYP